MGAWTFVLSSLGGVAEGELSNASERKVELALNRTPTASFRVRLDHPRASELLIAQGLIKAYERNSQSQKNSAGTLRFCGPITSAQEVGDDSGRGTLNVTAAGAFWRLQKRLVGKSSQGYSKGTAAAQLDLGAIAQDLIAMANADGDTGIRIGTITASSPGYVGPWYYKPIAEAITELSATSAGYDFEVAPVEPTSDASGVQIGTFNAAPIVGADRTQSAFFEYGGGKRNVKGYSRQVSLDGLMNAGYNLPSGFPAAGGAVVSATDPTSIGNFGLFEDVVPGDLTVDFMRQLLVNEHLRIRKNPRQQITFEPSLNGPEYGIDYAVGDLVQARAWAASSFRFDVACRVYGASFSIDDEGLSVPSLTLIPEA